MTPTPADSVLRRTLWGLFTLLQEEAAGTLLVLPVVRSRYADLDRAWAACPAAERVYAETRAAWEAATGRCAVCAAAAPCACARPVKGITVLLRDAESATMAEREESPR